MHAKYYFYNLITSFKKILIEESMRLILKTTIAEYIIKIEVLIRPNLKFAAKDWHKKAIMKNGKYDKRIFELKKEWVYEKGFKRECITIHEVLLK